MTGPFGGHSSLDGDARFEFRRNLGEGGYGVVYEMWDRTRSQALAIKRLRKTDPVALLRFKQEFRSVADVRHRNLVRLDEMFSRDDDWFVAMELVDGVDLLDWVRPVDRLTKGFKLPFDEGLLRESFVQLCEGLLCLHQAGMLHRDLKPSNVLVERDGRVVVLDFGLVSHLGLPEISTSNLVGTPAYMAPEHVTGARLTEAADWYCVGLMLYEALTGRLPFEGNFMELLQARVHRDPVPPRDHDSAIPRDLDALCRALLDRDPLRRPAGAEVARRLRRDGTGAAESASGASRTSGPFVGRAPHLAVMHDAFEHARLTAPAMVHLTGASGMGKTTLARHFLATLQPDALVFSGRCYQRESVPFKAVDSVVDGVSRHLKSLSAADVARVVPRDMGALARMFPVLREFDEATLSGSRGGSMPLDAQELRRRGFSALRELLQRLGSAQTLVLFVDDLQWGDLDSGQLLLEVLRPPDPPRLLFIACYRPDEAADSPLLQLLGEIAPGELRRWNVTVGELAPEEARDLALSQLDGQGADMRIIAEALAEESHGNPFIVDQLAHFRRAMKGASSQTLRLESVIDFRLAQLPADARRLVEVIAVVGRPLDLRIANQAAGLDPHAVDAVEALRGGRWIRGRVVDAGEMVETYHDRLRETVVSLLPRDQLPAIHTRVALALESGGMADAEALAEHFQQAGDRVLAARHAVRAADTAGELLAFDRAARLYRLALELGEFNESERRALRTRLGEALTNLGRGEEAGRTYLSASHGAGTSESMELQRRAAERFLMSGLIDEGVEQSARVLGQVGLKFAPTPRRALLRLVLRRAQLWLRGIKFTPRAASELSPDLLRRMDVTWSVGAGLSMADPIQANYFQVTNLLNALRAGEPFRVARALVMELAVSSMGGSRSLRRTEELYARCAELVRQVDHPYTSAWFALVQSLTANLGGRYAEAVDAAQRSEKMFREGCTGVAWEVETAQLYHLHSLVNLGRWKAAAQRALPLLAEARERRDLYLATYVQTRNLFLFHLAADEVGRAREEQDRSLEGWTRHGFQLQHYWNWYARCEIDLYAGEPRVAWERLQAQWRRYSRSLLPRTQALHVEILFLRVRAAVARAVSGDGDAEALLRHAAADVRRLEKERIAWAAAQAALGRALIANARGQGAATGPMFAAAADMLDHVNLEHFAAAARLRAAAQQGGGANDGSAWLTREEVRRPDRMLAMLAPVRWT
ncbi:MAG: serine/threonine-protein kinase [Gemmatimonadaceae bacterium]